MINYIKNIPSKYEIIFTIVISFSLWFSIGTKIQLNENFMIEIISKNTLNNLRFIFPFIILFFCLVRNRFNKQISKIFFLTTLLIFFSYLIGYLNFYFLNTNYVDQFLIDKDLIKTGYLPSKIRDIFFCFYFLITFLILTTLKPNQIKLINILNYCFITLVSCITLYYSYMEYINTNKAFLYYSKFLVDGEILGVASIRSLGLARNLLICAIPLIIYNLFYNKNTFIKYFLNILIIIFLANLFQTQSRVSIFSSYFFILIIFLVCLISRNYKKLLSIFLITILLPSLLSLSIPKIKSLYFEDVKIESRVFTSNPNNIKTKKTEKKIDGIYLNEVDEFINIYSSGRLELWKKTLNLILYEDKFKFRLIGFGPLSDRYFLKENSSNAMIFVLFSGGLLGFFSLILLYLFTLNEIFKYILNIKHKQSELFGFSIISIIIFILIRSLVENSFLVFGTDHIIFFSGLLYLTNKNKEFKTIN